MSAMCLSALIFFCLLCEILGQKVLDFEVRYVSQLSIHSHQYNYPKSMVEIDCAALCLRNSKCFAYEYTTATLRCVPLVHLIRHDVREEDTGRSNSVKVMQMVGVPACPSNNVATFVHPVSGLKAFYYLYRQRADTMNWYCGNKRLGRPAAISTKEEVKALLQIQKKAAEALFVGAFAKSGSWYWKNPMGQQIERNWLWQNSSVPEATDGMFGAINGSEFLTPVQVAGRTVLFVCECFGLS